MAVWSSLKYAVVASCAISLSQVEALPAVATGEGMTEWASHPKSLLPRQQVLTVTGIRDGVAQGRVPVRKEIREMMNNTVEFELFLLALQRFYSQPQSSDTSYYGISGIHGRPYKAWNGVANGRGASPNTGYCTHGDILFLPWHRPYLAIYEQLIWDNAREVVNSFPDSDSRKASFRTALPGLRIPYWDWAADASIPVQVREMKNIEVANPRGGRQNIANPLYSYKFTDLSEFPDRTFSRMQETTRWPQLINGRYESQPQALNDAMTGIGGNLKTRVYQLLVAAGYKDFNLIGTTGTPHTNNNFLDSLESVHDTIHGTVGSGGHMGFVPYAAFDPIFWLHHTNIDRLFAIWQGINPQNFVVNGRTGMGTFTMAAGTTENMSTPLTPFRQTGNAMFTSSGVVRTSQFGYAYPETVEYEGGRATSADITATVNRIYGRQAPAGVLREATQIARRKRSLGEKVRRADAQPNQDLNVPPAAEKLAPVEHKIVDKATDKYNEWVANIKVNSGAFNGTFGISAFIGDATTEVGKWPTDKNFVGAHAVFADNEGGHKGSVSGVIPLTSALLNKIVGKELDTLVPESVVPYLLKNLKLTASIFITNQQVELKSVKDLQVEISTAEVTLPQTERDAPVWGDYQNKIDWVDVAAGKFGPQAA
ncbi:hypothetical protein H072_3102 [Dactylellina haptotyla CBS 200.50]|uniref:tyrosinase n=1 Tax=Dactylellina haptotyla (strain CBS 200.50) TaxID=1284197 RepID=S8AP51_DACHA|nr:hypothetical protein H072_3102 [Dactylellina haptotyla CBS 200.50]